MRVRFLLDTFTIGDNAMTATANTLQVHPRIIDHYRYTQQTHIWFLCKVFHSPQPHTVYKTCITQVYRRVSDEHHTKYDFRIDQWEHFWDDPESTPWIHSHLEGINYDRDEARQEWTNFTKAGGEPVAFSWN